MASLQDQLLKAGVINKNKAKKVKNDQHKQAKVVRKMGGKTVNEAKAAVVSEQTKKIERDRDLNLKKQQDANHKSIIAQIKQLIDLNKIKGNKGDIHYSFVYDNKVKHIFVGHKLKIDEEVFRCFKSKANNSIPKTESIFIPQLSNKQQLVE